MPTTAEATQEPKQDRRHEQRALLPKKCLYCERRFSKAEHLKRHQRSHTGERPYRCSRCQKCFSRSDVLIRHLKNHPQIPGEDLEHSSSDGDQGSRRVKRRASSSSAVGLSQMNEAGPSCVQDLQSRPLSPSRIDPALLGAGDYHEQAAAHAMASGLDHLALLATQQSWGNGAPVDASMADAGNGVIGNGDSQTWGPEAAQHNQDFTNAINYQHGPAPSDSEYQMMSAVSNHHSSMDFGNDLYSGRLGALQDQISPVMGGMTPSGSMMPSELMNWFDQFDMEANNPAETNQTSGRTPEPMSQNGVQRSTVPSEGGNSSKSPGSVSTIIPTERFHKVERCWPNRQSNAIRLMPTLWRDAISKSEDNLFSKDNLTPEAIEHNRQYGSRWGLDEDCRTRLQKMFVNLSRKEPRQGSEGCSPFSHSSPSVNSSATNNIQEEMSNIPNFPPAEIFDISLDLFFRQFHPLMPFIHTPTFCPKTAPTSILLIMCLIGLTILQTKGATAFVRQAFPRALEKVCTELMSPPREGRRIDQLSSLASAVFILNLSEMTGDRAHHEQCQMLYTNVITTAQRHGLLSTKDAQPLEDSLFMTIPDLDARWKAWARVECVKRLICCLPMVDTWYSAIFHTSPVMRTDDIRMVLPCDASLFQASSAQKWEQLISKGRRMCMPTVVMSSDMVKLPEVIVTLDVHAMTGILCIIRLRISESFHRMLSGSQRRAVDHSFVPWKTYESDIRARASQHFTTQIMQSYGTMISSMNPNCMVLWHNMCIMLTTDLRLFELGAGCSGPDIAREALDDIAIWSKTSAARRACIHAGQTFTLMQNRRASDGDPFHGTVSLFVSALVLGLYVFMASPEDIPKETGPGFDLIEEVDWSSVGSEGLTDEPQAGNDPANNFIKNGGRICFDGVVHQPGYEAARRILLDYARLLEDIGKWRVGAHQYSRVLRIMSDALVDVEASGE
ncbi:fungal-specific transcription factor domain-containing protein [Amylocarpus encephaloides]|uniref:Fungal-specific transcription factor domain-containing protein n=1 Tax=Amylocarpus encephaloides TaxID=45428 RepID=A0A9P7YHN5_9HELO|nr:fungal-specific transcription factor domain-containing protein [Amylocarpus encephaloides]